MLGNDVALVNLYDKFIRLIISYICLYWCCFLLFCTFKQISAFLSFLFCTKQARGEVTSGHLDKKKNVFFFIVLQMEYFFTRDSEVSGNTFSKVICIVKWTSGFFEDCWVFRVSFPIIDSRAMLIKQNLKLDSWLYQIYTQADYIL